MTWCLNKRIFQYRISYVFIFVKGHVNGKAGLAVSVIVGTVSVIPDNLLFYQFKFKFQLTTSRALLIFTFSNNR